MFKEIQLLAKSRRIILPIDQAVFQISSREFHCKSGDYTNNSTITNRKGSFLCSKASSLTEHVYFGSILMIVK